LPPQSRLSGTVVTTDTPMAHPPPHHPVRLGFSPRDAHCDLPVSVARRVVLSAGLALALGVYYLIYLGEFEEGAAQGASGASLVLRMVSVALIALPLLPLAVPHSSVALFILLFGASACWYLLGISYLGQINDAMFINTVLQLPVLLAFASTRRKVDPVLLLRVVCGVLVVQTAIDAIIWLQGASLWLSNAFIGGLGNPSSFGLMCAVGLAFCLLHPQAGRWRWPTALVLAAGSVMSLSLFAALAVAFVAAVWMLRSWRNFLVGSVAAVAAGFVALVVLFGPGEEEDAVGFLEHKLSALGALIGLVDYDVASALTVSMRLEMHQDTAVALANDPLRLLWGRLDGLLYWPMDSQVLTYLGSFGLLMLAVFVVIHVAWMARAWRVRHRDGGFAFLILTLFGGIFATNRILDYFPIATIYFLVVASCLNRTPPSPQPLPRVIHARRRHQLHRWIFGLRP
jgi:hypothetical protein